jgi:predicted dehydrogenase
VSGPIDFATLPPDGSQLRVVVVGAGVMGKAWLQAVETNPDVEIVGIADIYPAAAAAAATELGRNTLPVGSDGIDLARRTGAQAIVNATIPEAHYPLTLEALLAGFPVLGEKPVASTVTEGLSLAAAAELTGQLFMVSQSRRYNKNLHLAKKQTKSLGTAGIVAVDFFKAPRFGGFRDQMDSPLLLDMAIHQFDMARFLLDADPVAVTCEEYNPSWSWYSGNAAANAIFEMEDGARFSFNGSWCSPGLETSWNGSWRISAQKGSVLWDGETAPDSDFELLQGSDVEDPGNEIEGSLREFVLALRTGTEPMGRVHHNIMSLAMVEGAMRSAALKRRVRLDEVLDDSYEEALGSERNEHVVAVLRTWPSVRAGLRQIRGTA